QATCVLPTPVSDPVMKRPCMGGAGLGPKPAAFGSLWSRVHLAGGFGGVLLGYFLHAIVKYVSEAVQQRMADCQRGHHDDDVPQGAEQDALLAGQVAEAPAHALLGGEGGLRRAVLYEFDPGQQAALADVAGVGELAEPVEVAAEALGLLRQGVQPA